MVVLLTDLVNSRKLENRQAFDKKLDLVIKKINNNYEFHAPLVRTKGIDEMSAVFVKAADIPHACLSLQIELPEVAFRFAVSDGEIDIISKGKGANELDGLAFHNAGAFLAGLEVSKSHFSIALEAQNWIIDNLVSNLIEFCLLSVRNWPTKSGQIAALAWNQGRVLKQKKIAEEMKISPQAVSSALNRTNFHLIRDSIRSLENTLQN